MRKLLSKVIFGILTVGILVGSTTPIKANAAINTDRKNWNDWVSDMGKGETPTENLDFKYNSDKFYLKHDEWVQFYFSMLDNNYNYVYGLETVIELHASDGAKDDDNNDYTYVINSKIEYDGILPSGHSMMNALTAENVSADTRMEQLTYPLLCIDRDNVFKESAGLETINNLHSYKKYKDNNNGILFPKEFKPYSDSFELVYSDIYSPDDFGDDTGDGFAICIIWFDKVNLEYYYYTLAMLRDDYEYDIYHLGLYKSTKFHVVGWNESGRVYTGDLVKIYHAGLSSAIEQLFKGNKARADEFIDVNYGVIIDKSYSNAKGFEFVPSISYTNFSLDHDSGDKDFGKLEPVDYFKIRYISVTDEHYMDIGSKCVWINEPTILGSYKLTNEEVHWDMDSGEFEFDKKDNISKSGLIVNKLIHYFATDICGNVQNQEQLASVDIQKKIDEKTNSVVVKAVLSEYVEQLNSCLEDLKLTDWADQFTKSDDLYKDYTTPIDVLTAICRNSIASMEPDGSIKFNTGYFTLGYKKDTQLYISLDTSSKGGDAVMKSKYGIEVMSIDELYNECPIDEVCQLMLTYQFVWSNYETGTTDKNICLENKIGSFMTKTFAPYNGTYNNITVDNLSLADYIAINSSKVKNVTADGTILSYLKYTDVIGWYSLYQCLYGLSFETDSDIYNVYNAELDTAMRKYYLYQLNEFYFPDKILSADGICKDVLKYGLAGNCTLEEDTVPDAYYYFLKHLYVTAYGFTITNGKSEYANNQGYSAYSIGKAFGLTDGELSNLRNDKLKDFPTVADAKTDNYDTEGNGMLQAVISLYDFCMQLGIDEGDWTDDISDYLKVLKILDSKGILAQLRENSNIKEVPTKGSTTIEEPLGVFYSIENQTLSDQWLKGFALSATFSPMNTNLYNADWAEFLGDVEWTSEFYYKYGFYRKALYINTDSSAIVNKFITGADSPTKVATLRDLLTYDRDIVLTVDDNFYNADQLASVLGMIDYASVKNNNQLESEDTGAMKEIFINIKELFDIQPEVILKTGPNKYYSSEVFNGATPLGGDEETSESSYDAYLLMKKDILSAIDAQEYSVQQPMAVVSAIYKSDKLFNQMLKCISVDNAIFKSSKAIASTPGTDEGDWLALYNYYMLANLSEQMRNDSASTLDLDAPIFCDIFGNIVTESGLVIIPAASNATICGPEWTPMSVGWADYYYNGEMMQFEDCSIEQLNFFTGATWKEELDGSKHLDSVAGGVIKESPCGGGWFSVDGKVLQIRTSEIHSANSSAVVQWSNLSKNSDNIKQIFYNYNYFDVGPNLYNFVTTNLITEVLRGAPIEYIDYTKEGLDGLKSATRFGVVAAYGLEKVADTVLNSSDGNFKVGNSMTTLPNLAFVEGIEYIVLFAFKIMFAAGIVMLAINLYLDAVQNQLGIKSVIRFSATLILTLLAVLVLPQVLNWSYYRANKALLTDDILYVQMLNYTKEFDGAEINVTTIDTPESNTELYLKLDDISLDWWDVLYEVLFESTNATVTELYEEELADNSYFGAPGVEIKSDGVYISVNDIFNSTTVTYLPGSNTLMNYTYKESDNLIASYVTPYYYFLDQLIHNINVYNSESAVEAYSYGIGQNGHLYTYELSAPYFKSADFMEDGYDILNLHHIFGTNSGAAPVLSTVNASDIDLMKFSLWWPSDMATEDMYVKIDNFYTYAKDYVANNAELIGKVPDEVFIKTMAMRLAVKWNDMFNIPMGDSIEIMNVDTRDLMRLIAGDKVDVYRYSSYGLARFVYEEGGIMGCIGAALFLGIVWVSNIFKVVVMLVIIGLLVINVFFRRTIYKGEGNLCIEGYIITCGLLAACNLLYSFMLKLCLTVTQYGMGTTSSFIFALAVQVLYLAALLGVLMVVVKDWQHSGLAEWQNVGAAVTHSTRELWQKATAGFRRGGSGNNRGHASSGMGEVTVASMLDRDANNEDQFVRENH